MPISPRPRRLSLLIGAGEHFRINQTFFIDAVQVFQRILVFVADGVGGDGSVVVQEVIAFGRSTKGAHQEGKIVVAGTAQTVGVVLTVSVRIVKGKLAHHVGEFIQRLGLLQTQLVQPVLTNPGYMAGGNLQPR